METHWFGFYQRMFKPRQAAVGNQQEFWIETRRPPQTTTCTFCRTLDETLDANGFREARLPRHLLWRTARH